MVEITRRDLLQTTLAAGILSMTGARSHAAQAVVNDLRIISPEERVYCGWPTLTRLASGRLQVVWSGGREAHVCPFGRVETMHSDDGGQSWTWPRVLLDTALDDRDAGILETSRGTLLVTTFTSLAYEPALADAEKHGRWDSQRLARWQAARDRLTGEQRKQQLGTWMIRSVDGGNSWSPQYDCLVNSPHGPIQLADGRLLYAGKELWAGENRIGVCESNDDGQTWNWLAAIPTRGGDQHQDYHELHAVECASGRLVAHIRNHNSAHRGETLQSESSDGGATWSEPHSIGVWGLPSHLLRLKDGRLLMSYGYRRPPFGNQARLSSDEGMTWSDPLTISADGHSGDLGYPSTVQLNDQTLVTVWYELRKGSSHAALRQATWELKD